MGDAFIVRRGGGTGLSKCSIIVHVETGSTVAAYSNSAATTKVKDAKEIGSSGSFYITGLDTGTYYIKATKSGKSAIKSVNCNAYSIFEVTLVYEVVLFENGTISLLGDTTIISRTEASQVVTEWGVSGNNLYIRASSSVGSAANIYGGFTNAYNFSGKSTLYITVSGDGEIGINSTNTASYVTHVTVSGTTSKTYSIPLGSYQGNYRIIAYTYAPSGQRTGSMTISRIWVQ